MMNGNMQIDFNYRICCLKTRKLKPKFTQYPSAVTTRVSALVATLLGDVASLRKSKISLDLLCKTSPRVGHIAWAESKNVLCQNI